MVECLFIALLIGPAFGIPLLAIGVILRLCEWGWEKDRGELGSRNFLVVGFLLALPLAVYLGRALAAYIAKAILG